MVAYIMISAKLTNKLHYNEKKVKAHRAACIHAANYLKDASEMNIDEKTQRLRDLIELNQAARTIAAHIVLGFGTDELLDNEKMIDISAAFMHRIGYGNQPNLVYRHFDTANPHMHIVSTTIGPDGRQIQLPHVRSMPFRTLLRDLEHQFQLHHFGRYSIPAPAANI